MNTMYSRFLIVCLFSASVVEAAEELQTLEPRKGRIVTEDYEKQDELLQLRSRPQSNILKQEIPNLQTLDAIKLHRYKEGPEEPSSANKLRPLVKEMEAKEETLIPEEEVKATLQAEGVIEPEPEPVKPAVEEKAEPEEPYDPVKIAIGREELRLWQWLKLGRYSQIETKITELRRTYPSWTPPSDLVRILDETRQRRALENAVKNGNWSMVMFTYKQHPEWFNCEQFYNLWALADAQQGMGNREAMIRLYQGMMDNCSSEKVRVDTYRRATPQLTFEELSAMVDREESREVRRLSDSTLGTMQRELATTRMLKAAENGEDGTVIASIPMLRSKVIAEQDSGMALIFGWALFRQDRLVEADEWFRMAHNWNPTPETIQALATMYNRLGRLDDAEALARTNLEEPLMRDLLSDILSQRARDAFDDEDYQTTIDYFEEAEEYGELTVDDLAVYGWSHYHLGHYDIAAGYFERSYPDSKSDDVAQGLFYSLRENNGSRLLTVAREQEGPLKTLVDREYTQEAYGMGLYHKAYNFSPDTHPQLETLNNGGLLGGMFFHFRSGQAGRSQLYIQRLPIVAGELDLGQHLFDLELSAISMSSGTLRDYAVIGSYPGEEVEYSYEPTTEIRNSLEPMFFYQYEDKFSPYFSIGLTPLKSAVGSRLQGNLGFNYLMGRGSFGMKMFSKPVKESILSYVGIFDPYSGTAWGGVDMKGFDANLYFKLTDSIQTTMKVQSAHLEGTQVVSNDMLEFNMDVKKTWSGYIWEEIAVGPTYSFYRYNQNLGQFTLGHGGYFSPQQMFKFGGELSMSTWEVRDFITKGRLSLGFQQHKANCSPLFPASSNLCDENYQESRDEGMYLSTELVGMGLVDDHVQLGGGVFYATSPEFDEFGFMLALRLTAEPRKSLIAEDIPTWIDRAH